jgi:hypothetical protein
VTEVRRAGLFAVDIGPGTRLRVAWCRHITTFWLKLNWAMATLIGAQTLSAGWTMQFIPLLPAAARKMADWYGNAGKLPSAIACRCGVLRREMEPFRHGIPCS